MKLHIRYLDTTDYEPVFHQMKQFMEKRFQHPCEDELWITQHRPVFTLGKGIKKENIPNQTQGIPVIPVDRGGQITYHGPGQLVFYFMLNIARLQPGVRRFVNMIQQTTIETLSSFNIQGKANDNIGPGVFVDNQKIASLGFRVKRGYTYHGLSLNVDMDLTPFSLIHPCGVQGLPITQMANLIEKPMNFAEVTHRFEEYFMQIFSYTSYEKHNVAWSDQDIQNEPTAQGDK